MEAVLRLQTYPPRNARRKDTQTVSQYLLCSPPHTRPVGKQIFQPEIFF